MPPTPSPTLLGLLEHYSPSGREAEAVAWFVAHMQQMGATKTFTDAVGNGIGIWGEGERTIVLLGHIDTVPGKIPVRIVEERGQWVIYGRGSVDAKGPLAAMVDAAAQVGPRPGWRLVVIAAIDEEGESRGARYVANYYRPAFAIIGEPSGWSRVTLGYKGSARARLEVQLAQGHSAGPHGSAADLLLEAWQRLWEAARRYNQGKTRVFEQLQLTVRGLGSQESAFEQRAWMHLAARLPEALPPEAFYHWLQGNLPEGVVWQREGFPIQAYRAPRNTPLVRAFLAAIRGQGARPGFVLKSGTADLNIVAPVWGCPALAYGPGDSALDHTPYEHLSLQEYRRAVQVLTTVLNILTSSI